MFKKLFKFAWITGLIGAFCAALGCGVMALFVFFGDTTHLEKSAIRELIEEQSTVYCDDGASQVGSFIGNSHRQYVPFAKIPVELVRAIVCLLYTSPSPRDATLSRMPSSA